MSDDIRRAGGYNKATLRFQWPKKRSLNDLRHISVWCVPVGISFGDGVFKAS